MPLFRPLPLFVYIWAEAGPHISYPVIPGTGIAGASQSLLQRRGLCCVPAILAVSSYSPHASKHPCQSRPGPSETCSIAGPLLSHVQGCRWRAKINQRLAPSQGPGVGAGALSPPTHLLLQQTHLLLQHVAGAPAPRARYGLFCQCCEVLREKGREAGREGA